MQCMEQNIFIPAWGRPLKVSVAHGVKETLSPQQIEEAIQYYAGLMEFMPPDYHDELSFAVDGWQVLGLLWAERGGASPCLVIRFPAGWLKS